MADNKNSKKTLKLLFWILILSSQNIYSQNINFSGTVIDSNSRRWIVNAKVTIENPYMTYYTDNWGEFDFNLEKKGIINIRIEQDGYNTLKDTIDLNDINNLKREYVLFPQPDKLKIYSLNSVDISVNKNRRIDLEPVSVYQLTGKKVKETPIVYESDVFQTLQLLPSISKGSDFSGKMNIRGSSQYQSLILIDDVPIFNPFHLGGLTGIFNSDLVGNVNLYSGAYPVDYSGAISSVMNIKSKDTYPEKMKIFGSAGILTSSVTYNNKLGDGVLLLSGRRTYFDIIAKYFIVNLPDGYYDLFGKYRYTLDSNDFLSMNVFYTKDNFSLLCAGTNTYNTNELKDPIMENYLYSIRWEHYFSQNNYLNLLLYGSNNKFRYYSEGIIPHGSSVKSGEKVSFNYNNLINQNGIILKYKTRYNEKLLLSFGFEFKRINLNYNWKDKYLKVADEGVLAYSVFMDFSPPVFQYDSINNYISVFNQSEYEINNSLKAILGLRIDKSFFYSDILYNIFMDMNYKINNYEINLSFSNKSQNLVYYDEQRISSFFNAYSLPFFPSYTDLPKSKQVRIAIKNDKLLPGLGLTFETYLNAKSNLSAIPDSSYNKIKYSEDSYGIELNAEYQSEYFSGSLSYALSKSLRTEGGLKFPGNLDQRHNLKGMAVYNVTNRFDISMEFFFNTGYPYVFPKNSPLFQSYGRNEARMNNYFRADLTMQYKYHVWGGTMTPFLSVLNIFNKDNRYIEGYQINDFTGKTEIKYSYGLPVIPNIGVRFEY
jgi:hypothetical protein